MNEKLALANALVGSVLPHAIALVNQCHWPSRVKRAVAFGCCAIAAAFTSWIGGELHPDDLLLSVLVVFGAAQISYRAVWHPTGIAPAIEEATTITDPPPP